MTAIQNNRTTSRHTQTTSTGQGEAATRTQAPTTPAGGRPADVLVSGSQPGSHVATDRAGEQPSGGGTSQLGLLASNRRAPAQGARLERQLAEIDRSAELLRGLDADGNGVIRDTRLGNELQATDDPLARAVYDFVNFGNYSGHTSLYGESTRGDVMTGGLGLGYTLRPEHYTSQGYVSERDLTAGVNELKARLEGRRATADLPAQDLERIANSASAAGLLSTRGPARYGEIHAATERLLRGIEERTERKERDTGNSEATLRLDELFGPSTVQVREGEGRRARTVDKPVDYSLPEGSLERLIAEQVLRGPAEQAGGGEHWMDHFQRGIDVVGRDDRTRQKGTVGDLAQHYLLVVGKRAKETEFVEQIKDQLAQRVD